MKVNISDILRVNGASIELDFVEAPPVNEPAEGYLLDGELSFSGRLTNVNGIIQLKGVLKAVYKSECYRCLKTVKKALELEIDESFTGNADTEESGMYCFEGKVLDIGKAFNDNIILNLPMKILCSDDCKGLCMKCGTNLNEVQCGCSKDDIEPRLEDLNKYFDKE
ncbi:MAG: DUF177 domain-containing protein [Clostridiaceae bacterium]